MPESMLSESSESELQTLLTLSNLFIFISLCRNLTLISAGVAEYASPGSVQRLAIINPIHC